MNIKPSKKGWIVTKNGRHLNTPDVTKRSMLIGYDMMPLRGLRKAEKSLRKYPYDIRRVVLVYDAKSRLYGASVNGRISLKLATFSNIEDSIERTKKTTAFAISGKKEYNCSAEENKTLSGFYFLCRDRKNSLLPEDKRQKKRLLKLRLEVERIFEKLNIVIVPVKFVLE